MKTIANLILRLALISALTISLLACAQVKTDPLVQKPPPYPLAGPAVADELQKHCFPKLEDSHKTLNLCPATAEWLARLDKLHDQLEVQ